jgi:hypothetical protein
LKRGFVDASRIAMSGWSYGGYMTSWLIGHDARWNVEGHFPGDPVRTRKLDRRWVNWLAPRLK